MRMSHLDRFRAIDQLESRLVPATAASSLAQELALAARFSLPFGVSSPAAIQTPVTTGSSPANLHAGQLPTMSTTPTNVTTSLPGLTAGNSVPTTAGTVPGAPLSSNPGLGFATNISGVSPFVLTYPALGGYVTSGVAYSTVGGFSQLGLPVSASANAFEGVNLGGTGSINGVSFYNGVNYLTATVDADASSEVGINSAFLGNTLTSSALSPAGTPGTSGNLGLYSGLSSSSLLSSSNGFTTSPFASISPNGESPYSEFGFVTDPNILSTISENSNTLTGTSGFTTSPNQPPVSSLPMSPSMSLLEAAGLFTSTPTSGIPSLLV